MAAPIAIPGAGFTSFGLKGQPGRGNSTLLCLFLTLATSPHGLFPWGYR